MKLEHNLRILLVDDNSEIHRDFAAILAPQKIDESALDEAESALFGDTAPKAPAAARAASFELDTAHQGREALEKVTKACEAKRPYAMAFVDMRMPPGWDGVETIERMWKVDPDLQIVVCTAFADYTWPEMASRLEHDGRWLVLKKPFDTIEVCQLAAALCAKWNTSMRERAHLAEVEAAEREARAYASSLETVNRALEASRATAEAELQSKQRFLLRLTTRLAAEASSMERAFATILVGEPTDPRWIEAVDSVCTDTHRLASSIESVRELAALELDALPVQLEDCNIDEVVARVVERSRERARKRGLELVVERDRSVPSRVHTQRAWVERILASMLDVVVADPARGKVTLAIESRSSAEGDVLRLALRASTADVQRASIGALLEPYAAPHDAGDLDQDGSMLGLGLSRRLAQALGGHLCTDDRDVAGGLITLTIPLERTLVSEER